MGVTIRNLTHVYDSAAEPVVALAGLDLDLASGSVTVVRGPNGSGKSTLVAALRGAIKPTAGTIEFAPQTVSRATITQFGNVIPDLTVREHVELLGQGSGGAGIIGDDSDKRAGDVSRAVQQHLAATLLDANSAGLVLADEPAASLSHEDAVSLYRRLADQCRAAGSTLLLVTHDYRAEAVADTVVRIRDGRISEVWEPGSGERQAIDSRGWLRLPDRVRARFANSAEIVDGDTVHLDGGAPPAPRVESAQRAEAIRAATATNVKASVHMTTAIDVDRVALYSGMVDVSGRCCAGTITHVAGPAGSGTSAMLRALVGLQPVASGDITYDAVLLTPDGTPDAVLASSEHPLGGRQTLRDMGIATSVLSALDLENLRTRPLDTLSGGQRQRALVAIALATPASIVALDEPTVNLDPYWRDRCMAVLREHAARGRIIIAATHDDDTIDATDTVISMLPTGNR